jgi:hypothetical protein
MLRQIISASLLTVSIAVSLLSIAPPAHAETVSQCRERAYRYYDYLIAEETPQAEAAQVLHEDLRACEAR